MMNIIINCLLDGVDRDTKWASCNLLITNVVYEHVLEVAPLQDYTKKKKFTPIFIENVMITPKITFF